MRGKSGNKPSEKNKIEIEIRIFRWALSAVATDNEFHPHLFHSFSLALGATRPVAARAARLDIYCTSKAPHWIVSIGFISGVHSAHNTSDRQPMNRFSRRRHVWCTIRRLRFSGEAFRVKFIASAWIMITTCLDNTIESSTANIILNYILLPVTDTSLDKLIDLAALCSNNGHYVALEKFIDGFAFALMRC